MKLNVPERPESLAEVSNPWREAIEEGPALTFGNWLLFPILGGRLLKLVKRHHVHCTTKVSNPWREAIEENISDHKISYELLYSLTKEVYHKSVLVSSFHLSHRNIFL